MNISSLIKKLNSGYILQVEKKSKTCDMYGIQDGKIWFGYKNSMRQLMREDSMNVFWFIAKRKGYYRDVNFSFHKKNLGMVSKSTQIG